MDILNIFLKSHWSEVYVGKRAEGAIAIYCVRPETRLTNQPTNQPTEMQNQLAEVVTPTVWTLAGLERVDGRRWLNMGVFFAKHINKGSSFLQSNNDYGRADRRK